MEPWSAMERDGGGGKGGGGGEGGEGGHALGPFDRVQSREAMGRDGTMEPWGHEPLRRVEGRGGGEGG